MSYRSEVEACIVNLRAAIATTTPAKARHLTSAMNTVERSLATVLGSTNVEHWAVAFKSLRDRAADLVRLVRQPDAVEAARGAAHEALTKLEVALAALEPDEEAQNLGF